MTDDPVLREASKLAATQLPPPCEFDQTMMVNSEKGIRCPKCGHEVFDLPRASERPDNPMVCDCLNCSGKHRY